MECGFRLPNGILSISLSDVVLICSAQRCRREGRAFVRYWGPNVMSNGLQFTKGNLSSAPLIVNRKEMMLRPHPGPVTSLPVHHNAVNNI